MAKSKTKTFSADITISAHVKVEAKSEEEAETLITQGVDIHVSEKSPVELHDTNIDDIQFEDEEEE